eukprot:6206314-Pleurochrysis_carterae.AAC.1
MREGKWWTLVPTQTVHADSVRLRICAAVAPHLARSAHLRIRSKLAMHPRLHLNSATFAHAPRL